MKLVIDRFEGDWCVCEYRAGETIDLPRALLPEHAKEGDVLTITIDRSETEQKKKQAEELKNKLFGR